MTDPVTWHIRPGCIWQRSSLSKSPTSTEHLNLEQSDLTEHCFLLQVMMNQKAMDAAFAVAISYSNRAQSHSTGSDHGLQDVTAELVVPQLPMGGGWL
ncbi:hypothetical protein BJX61DRAFT_526933 [Aspergillus egyptiacus]|nr:hypothetical protein BJX61DRAFT_526933 [Aspergillus egyptiacus]